MNENWRELRVGDLIVMRKMQSEFSEPGYYLHKDTRLLYEHLVETAAPLIVDRIDDTDLPWVDYRWIKNDGSNSDKSKVEQIHSIIVNHDGWVKVPKKV